MSPRSCLKETAPIPFRWFIVVLSFHGHLERQGTVDLTESFIETVNRREWSPPPDADETVLGDPMLEAL